LREGEREFERGRDIEFKGEGRNEFEGEGEIWSFQVREGVRERGCLRERES
jgi:hypothetical protein